jgi:hypothetical protein
MAQDYRQAFEQGQDRSNGHFFPVYPLNNWIIATVLETWFGSSGTTGLQAMEPQFASFSDQAISQTGAANQDFWAMVAAPDGLLAMDLLRHTLNSSHSLDVAAIADGYRAALTRGASFREKQAVIEHLDFLQAMARASRKTSLHRQLSALLDQLTD